MKLGVQLTERSCPSGRPVMREGRSKRAVEGKGWRSRLEGPRAWLPWSCPWLTGDNSFLKCQFPAAAVTNDHKLKVKVAQSCLTFCDPMDCTVHGILQARVPEWVAFLFSRGSSPTQGSNPGLPHCGWILYQLSHQGSPRILEWVAYPFSRGSSQPRNWTRVSCIPGGFFTSWAMREAHQLSGLK